MNRSSFARRCRLVALLVVALASSPAVTRGEEPVAAPAAGAAAPELETIPIGEITERAEVVIAELGAMLPDDGARADLRAIHDRTQQLTGDVASRVASAEATLTGSANLRRLRELELQLLNLESSLVRPDQELQQIVADLTASIDRLDEKSALWKRTRDEARRGGAAPSTLDRIVATRRAIDQTRGALVAHRNETIAVGDELVEPRANLARAIQQVRGAITLRIKEVFFADGPPLWSGAVRESLRSELQEGWYDPIGENLERVRAYASQRAQLIFFQLALFVALALGLRAVRTRAKERADESYDLREAERVFEFPTSMALLIALGLTPQLHHLAPHFFYRVVMTVSVFPVVLIARRLAPPALSPLVFGIPVFFLLDRARDLAETLPTLERLMLVTELVAAIAFVLWLLRPSRFARIPAEMLREPFFRVVGIAMRVVVVLFGGALVAECVGLGNLSDLIGNGTLRAAYGALFIFALLKVLQSFMAYALVLKPLRLLYLVSRRRWLVRQRLDKALTILAISLWAYASISLMGFHGAVESILGKLLGATLSVGAASISFGDVVVFGLTLWLSLVLARFVDFVLNEDVYPRVRLARGVPYAISTLVRYAVIFLGFMVALAAAGIELTKLTVVAGGLGVGIGFGLQTVVNNFVSGLILLFERPVQVGDAVELHSENLRGEILRIGIRASVLRTFDGAEVIVPNGRLIADSVTNWTLSDRRRRVELLVGVEYGTDAQRVIDLLLEIAGAHALVLSDPAPTAFFLNFGDSALEFQMRVWIADFDERNRVRSELAIAIQQRLAAEGIGVPFPQRDLHLRSVSPRAASELGRAAGGAAPSAPSGEKS
jgi:small-conductance mechanosensitive channel